MESNKEIKHVSGKHKRKTLPYRNTFNRGRALKNQN